MQYRGDEMRILIVDDDPGILNALRVDLESVGHTAVAAGDGRQAMKLIESSLKNSEPFDLMITDLRMQGMSGMELIRSSRRVQGKLPTVLMTAYGDEDLRKKVMALGGCSYLEKPFTPEKLHRVIEEM